MLTTKRNEWNKKDNISDSVACWFGLSLFSIVHRDTDHVWAVFLYRVAVEDEFNVTVHIKDRTVTFRLIHFLLVSAQLFFQEYHSTTQNLTSCVPTRPVQSQHSTLCMIQTHYALIVQRQLRSQNPIRSSVDLSTAANFCDFKLSVPHNNGVHPYMFEMWFCLSHKRCSKSL